MRRKDEKVVKLRSLLTYGLVALAILTWLVWWQWDAVVGGICGAPAPAEAELDAVGEVPPGEAAAPDETVDEARSRWEEVLGAPPTWPGDLSDPESCREIEEQLANLCGYLEERGYSGSCGMLRESAEALAAHPPNLSSDLKQLGATLENVFHLFRRLRGQRIDFVRRIMREERALTEPAAMALYRWLASRERCARSGRTEIGMEPLYEYAAFLFHTVGGQAYLRRRSPEVEALAGFYALQILDRAIEHNYNPHGIDPRPEIERTRRLLEGQQFVFAERYLENLDDMARKWEDGR
jgi:hypothetical protein